MVQGGWGGHSSDSTLGQRFAPRALANVTFLLPANKYPKDFPNGNDLDNPCKRLFDALSKTIFSDARGKTHASSRFTS